MARVVVARGGVEMAVEMAAVARAAVAMAAVEMAAAKVVVPRAVVVAVTEEVMDTCCGNCTRPAW